MESSSLGHVLLSFPGKFKGEIGLNYHLIPIANTTSSWIDNRFWMNKFLSIRKALGETRGWAFKTEIGTKGRQVDLQEDFFELLEEVQASSSTIKDKVNMREEYGLSRSLRRGSNTHAHNMGVSEPRIELNNRWRKFFYSGGKIPTMGIRDSYIQVKQAIHVLLEYSSPL